MLRLGGAVYGYGRVYREYPQAQLEQQPPRRRFQDAQPPVRFPPHGRWQPHIMDGPPDATRALRVYLERLRDRRFSEPAIRYVPPWEVEQRLRTAVDARHGVVYLVRLPPRNEQAVPFPQRGDWPRGAMEPPDPAAIWVQFRLPHIVEPPAAPPPPIIGPWLLERQILAALTATHEIVVRVSGPKLSTGELPGPPGWRAVRNLLPALTATHEVVYRLRPASTGPLPGAGPPSWLLERLHWSALGATREVVYLVGIPKLPGAEAAGKPAWRSTRDLWAAIGKVQPVVYLVREPLGVETVLIPPAAWEHAREIWAALDVRREVVYLVRPAGAAIEQIVFVVPALVPRRERPRWQPPDLTAMFGQVRHPFLEVPLVIVVPPEGLVGVTVTNLKTAPLPHPPWVGGVMEEVDPKLVAPGTLADGENFVPQRAPRLAARGGSRILLTLNDDQGSPAELSHVVALAGKAATGAVAVGWSSATTKHYAYALTSDIAFAGASEALSRTAFPATWNRSTPARPVIATLFEKLYVADATTVFSNRNPMAVIDSLVPPTVTVPTFAFVAGGAGAAGLKAYCLEAYNNVLFIAGYGDEEAATGDDASLVRHNFLGKAPDAADGFDKDAYNTIGAKGDRVTAMKQGRGLLLVAKQNELYRISGFGRAYPGWQYAVEGVFNTQGFGVENPLALEHAEGFWFGIGKEGPFRTDGFTVESIVGPRQRTWRGVDQLGQSFVRYHPDRRLVLFGVHVLTGAPDATYPWVFMAWDTDRSVWQPNWRLAGNIRFFNLASVATTTVDVPQGPPTSPNTTLITETSFRANWTNGDAAARTEYWERQVETGGAWTLIADLDPGVALINRSGRTDHQTYLWKVRHKKSGVYSGFTAEQTVNTLMLVPGLDIVETNPPFFTHWSLTGVTSAAVLMNLQRSPIGAGTWSDFDTAWDGSLKVVDCGYDWRAKAVDANWNPTETAYGSSVSGSCSGP